jgi:hypothetical protein
MLNGFGFNALTETGASLVSTLDAYLGSSYWRNAGVISAQFVATYSDMLNFADPQDGQQFIVQDASGDPTVTSGAALYYYRESDTSFNKLSEYESLDVTNDAGDVTFDNTGTNITSGNVEDALKEINTRSLYEAFTVVCSDETTDIETGTGVIEFQMPFAMTVTSVIATVGTAPAGANIEVDINENGSSILSTVISIDAGEKTSDTASVQPVISDNSLATNSIITIDIDQVGSSTAGKGLKVQIIGTRVP